MIDMKLKLKSGIGVFLMLILFVSCLVPIAAEASTNNFYVRAVIPDNQVDKELTYFDLRLGAGETQTVQISVNNPSADDMTVKIALNPAITQRDGLIVYDKAEDTSALPGTPIDTIATVKTPEITVPASSSKLVDIEIKMPSQNLDGVILGGLVITAESANEAGQTEDSGNSVTLENEFNYIIGLKLTQNDNTVAPDFDLIGIEPGLINYRTSITTTLKNLKPIIVKNMKVEAQVYKKGASEPLYEMDVDAAEMAPDTSGKFIIDCNSNALETGYYRLKMRATYEGKVWEWDEEFQITKSQANDANKDAVNITKSYTVWLVIGIILLLVVLLLLVFLLGRRSRKSER